MQELNTTPAVKAPAETWIPPRPAQGFTPMQARHLPQSLGNRRVGLLIQRMCAECVREEEEWRGKIRRKAPGIAPKLAISQPNDPSEQEADRVARQVMRMPSHGSDETALRKTAGGTPTQPTADPMIPADAGRPLDRAVRDFFEPRFGADFGQVRLHTDAPAARAAQAVGARAFTYGSHIYFGEGEHRLATGEGRHLLAHELTHVLQQGIGGGRDIKNNTGQAKHLSGASCRSAYCPPMHVDPTLRIQRAKQKTVTFKKGETIVAQPLGPHLYDEIKSGIITVQHPGIGIGLWYRIYEARPKVDMRHLFRDLQALYGLGRFVQYTPGIAKYLNAGIPFSGNRFLALYPSKNSREPVDISKLSGLEQGIYTPRDIARPEISSAFEEYKNEAWKTLDPMARIFINDWADWSLRGLEKFLDEVPLQTETDFNNVLVVIGNLVWALSAFIPVLKIAAPIGVAGSLVGTYGSLAKRPDPRSKRDAITSKIKEDQTQKIAKIADELDKPEKLSKVFTTVFVKSKEQGLDPVAINAILWNHLFDIAYQSGSEGRRERLRLHAYYGLRQNYRSSPGYLKGR